MQNGMLIRDFKAEFSDTNIRYFRAIHKLKNLIKGPTRYKNLDNPTCIYLLLINCHRHL